MFCEGLEYLMIGKNQALSTELVILRIPQQITELVVRV